jgi:sulfate adenylyltransferase subunit 1 (EFTu-like GTPase family)
MEVLKIATAGSVDDGKSTLIGRLYDTIFDYRQTGSNKVAKKDMII